MGGPEPTLLRGRVTRLAIAARRGVRVGIGTPRHLTAVLVVLVAGVGCHLAMSGVWASVVNRSWPYDGPDSLVDVRVASREGSGSVPVFTTGAHLDGNEVVALRRLSTSFSWIGPYLVGEVQVGEESPSPSRAVGILSPGLLRALGTDPPILGRSFGPDDHVVPGVAHSGLGLPFGVAQPVVLLSYSLWSSAFGASPDVLNQSVVLNGVPVQIVGVMPPEFFFPVQSVAMWMPMRPATPSSRGMDRRIAAPTLARLRPGVSVGAARSEVTALLRNLGTRGEDQRAQISPLSERMTEGLRPALGLLRAGGWLFLLMGAVSCAGLRLSRSVAERHHAKTRIVLGASLGDELSGAIARVTVLAGLAFAGGTVLSPALLRLLRRLSPQVPLPDVWPLDPFVLGPALAAAALAACVAEAPATAAVLRLRRRPMAPPALGDVGGQRTLTFLLAIIVTVATIVAVLTATLGTNARDLLVGRGGFADTNLVQITVDFSGRSRTAPVSHWEKTAALDGAAASLARLPLVEAVGYADTLPDETGGMVAASSRAQSRNDPAMFGPRRAVRAISPGLLGMLGLTVRNGREFEASDNSPTERVVILDRNYPRNADEKIHLDSFPHVSGIGRARVVGISEPVRRFPSGESMPTAYRPFALEPNSAAGFHKAEIVVRLSDAPTEELVAAIAQVPAVADPLLRVRRAESIRKRRIRLLGVSVLAAGALAAFWTAGVLITLAGAVGAVLNGAAAQAGAIAVRRALGASDDEVVWEAGRRTLLALTGGGVLGGVLGFVASRIVSNRIPWVETGEAVLVLAPAGFLVLVTAAVCLWVARRAVRAEPWETLRSL